MLSRDNIGYRRDEDHLVLASSLNDHVRLIALNAKANMQKMLAIHDLSPLSAAISARLSIASLMLANGLKKADAKLSLRLDGEGHIRNIIAEANSQAAFRLSISDPHCPTFLDDNNIFDYAAAIKNGSLTVIKDYGLKSPYCGTVNLAEKADIANTVSHYLAKSEQIPSFLSLGLSIDKSGISEAGGLLVQVMPDITEEELSYLEQRVYGGFPDTAFLLKEGFSPAEIIDMFIGAKDTKYLEAKAITYSCPCSQEDMKRKILTLGIEDLQDLARGEEGIQVECHYCDQKYHFPSAELKEMIEKRAA